MTNTIYVQLLDEGISVWRPVSASPIRDSLFRIDEQEYDQEVERWEFSPGEIVRTQMREIDGERILAAVDRVIL